MKKVLSTLLIAMMASASFAAETPGVVETYACNLKPGKTLADLDKATAYFNGQVDAAGVETYFAATLVPVRANIPYDVIWVGAYPNLTTFANEETALAESGVAARVNAEFDEVVSCKSGLYFSNPLHSALPQEMDDNESMVQVFGCNFNDGKGPADLAAAHKAYGTAVSALTAANLGNFTTIQWMPYLANAPFDVAYLSVFDDMKSMAASDSMYYTSKEGAAAEAEWAKVLSCKSGLYLGTRVRQPAPQE